MTNATSNTIANNDALTRSAAKAQAVADWRGQALSQLTPKIYYMALPVFVMLTSIAAIVFKPLSLIGYALILVSFIACTFIAFRLSRRDRAIRAQALLTPTLDLEALRGQLNVLASSVKLLVESHDFKDALITKRALSVVYGAIMPILARGPVTIETATSPGYPPHPEVDVSTMPGDPSDFHSMHLMRIEASLQRLQRMVETQDVMIFDETVAHVAGELIPPLRALQHQLPSSPAKT